MYISPIYNQGLGSVTLRKERLKKKVNLCLENVIEDQCCDYFEVTQRDGYFVCRNCGAVASRVLDEAPRRIFTREQVRERKINEPVFFPIGHRTIIRDKKDASGHLLSPQSSSKFIRLSRINKSINTSYERNLWFAIPLLEHLCRHLSIPNYILEEALKIYKYIIKNKITKGRAIEVIMGASLYGALRVYEIPKTIDDIVPLIDVTKKKFNSCYSLISRQVLPKLGLKPLHLTPDKYISRFCSELKLSKEIENDALFILKHAIKKDFIVAGKDPKGIAAAVIQLSCKSNEVKRTQKIIAQTCKITEMTLRIQIKAILFSIISHTCKISEATLIAQLQTILISNNH